MRNRWIVVLSTAAVAAAFVGALYSLRGSHPVDSPESMQKAASENSAIIIDAQMNETFVPAEPGTVAPLTALDAFQTYGETIGASLDSPASGTNETLGWLTIPIGHVGEGGSMSYAAKDQLVWGFSIRSCPITTLPNPSPDAVGKCTHWLFLDASSGQSVDETWEQ